MTMKPANLSLLKLSSISSRCLLRRSGQVEGRSFVTIFNPAAPKLKRLQRSPGFEAQTHPAESEKVSMLRKALEEAKIELEDVKTEAPTSSLNGIEKTVHVTKDSSVRENITKPVKHESESVDITEEKKNSNSADDSISAPNSDVTTPQKDTCEDTKKVQTEIADSESRESREANCFVQGKKKKLTKKAKKPISSTSNTDHTEDDDSSSSSSDSGSSSSSSDSSSDDEAEEKKPVKSARLNQVHFDSNPTLMHCLSFRKYFLIWPSCLMLSHTHP